MFKLFKSIFLISFILFFCLTYLFAVEEITITTYYPSPYGSYNELTVASRQAIGDVNGDGGVDNSDLGVDDSGNPLPGSLIVAGNVGIGKRSPFRKLDVAGGASLEDTLFVYATQNADYNVGAQIMTNRSSVTGSNTALKLYAAGATNNYALIVQTGDVGIGTTTPQRTLDVSTNGQITFGNNGYSSTSSPGMFWYSDNVNYGIYKSAGSWSSPNYQQLTLAFATGIVIDGGSVYGKSGTVLQPNGGNVGIGMTTPSTSKLAVAGSIAGGETSTGWVLGKGAWGPDVWLRLTTTQAGSTYHNFAVGPFWANGATRYDLAEVTPVRKEDILEVGDVVCIDQEARVRMRRSQKAYDFLVAGIVSDPNTASMVIGGDTPPEKINSINDKKPIALVGRVLCKVSTENGPIEIGDLLVTSNKPGYAMKANIDKLKPGMVLGKAMESLKDGEGKIVVWVTLQ
ncbi:MAG: hypothetical protein PHC29_06230 [Candidatus Omnitrophica bacterium]|nr:hypothetical protein [Candidatus Omnitrophota bacterium]